MTRDANSAFAAAVVDEWRRAGVLDVCVAPGSRNAPLTLAAAGPEGLRVHVHVDERSAAFFALGCARGSGRPTVVCCTSGTATAHLHPAVLEASHAGVPLIVCTADRPPELRDTGAGQTIDQVGLYGRALRWSCDVDAPADRPGAGTWWRSIAARSVAAATGPPAGPVHLNVAFRDPLAPTGEPLVDAPGRDHRRPWTVTVPRQRRLDQATVHELAVRVRAARRGVLVAGPGAEVSPAVVDRFAAAAGWPVLADPLSGLRQGDHACATYDALLHDERFAASHRPDLVLRIGGPPTSAITNRWLADVPTLWLVDPDDRWLDPARTASDRLPADAAPLLADLRRALGDAEPSVSWRDDWRDADRRARGAIDAQLAGSEEPFEGRIARDVVAALPDGASLVVASSMPVRDVDSFAEPRAGLRFFANRGVNGIDGFVSTALGVAAATAGPTVGLAGDLSFLHDANGLLGAGCRDLDATLVVVDNDGGGIFSFLPYAATVAPPTFEQVLAAPPGVDVAAVSAAHEVPVTEVEKASALVPALERAVSAGGVRVVRMRTDRATNVARHEQVWSAVAAALRRREGDPDCCGHVRG
jgi:2-succinyl-5-enolpyruvyl-6-hydroxy-3-cyclohexene-1-carboxylate synthase